MAANTTQFREQINTIFSRLSLRQKLVLFIGIVFGLALIFVIAIWTAKPNFEVLFSNLSQKDAGSIVEKLKEKKIDYQLESGGTTILVPTDKVYELRLIFAQDGLPESSSVGYEIFDKTNLGMTDFIQQVNYRRALEGELARTIEQIDYVENARLHIVIPKESLFKEDQKETTASVVLQLKGTSQPSLAMIQGISHLIASSVEGLEPENITILDSRGRVLTNPHDSQDLVSLSGTQLDFNKKVENYLAQKTQSMLVPVLGPGNAVVRVTAELNFTQVEKNIEEYDPDNTAVRSEEIVEESTPVGSGETANGTGNTQASTSNSTVTNYEVNHTIRKVVEGVGNIKRLSVAVMVNNKKQIVEGEGGKKIQFIPRSQQEMDMLTKLVKTAVGLQAERGDQISVINVDFSTPTLEETMLQTDEPPLWDDWYDILQKVFLVLAIISAMLIMRSLFSYVRRRNDEIRDQIQLLKERQPASNYRLAAAGTDGSNLLLSGEEDSQDEVVAAENFFNNMKSSDPFIKNMQDYIKNKPEEAAKLIKVWLSEDDE